MPASGDQLRNFILDPSLSDEQLEAILESLEEYDSSPSLPQAALTARGLFAGDILRSALHKRHRVEFGVDRSTWRCEMAIPFCFKDAPSERTEFGHPDLAITLTLRAYAEDGLTKAAFSRVFQWLKELPLVEKTRRYRLWLQAAANADDFRTEAIEKAVAKRLKIPRSAEVLTFDDDMMNLLWPKLGKNLQVIETFLEEFVFPKETRQFPFKASRGHSRRVKGCAMLH